MENNESIDVADRSGASINAPIITFFAVALFNMRWWDKWEGVDQIRYNLFHGGGLAAFWDFSLVILKQLGAALALSLAVGGLFIAIHHIWLYVAKNRSEKGTLIRFVAIITVVWIVACFLFA
jgi:hypothetical protein